MFLSFLSSFNGKAYMVGACITYSDAFVDSAMNNGLTKDVTF